MGHSAWCSWLAVPSRSMCCRRTRDSSGSAKGWPTSAARSGSTPEAWARRRVIPRTRCRANSSTPTSPPCSTWWASSERRWWQRPRPAVGQSDSPPPIPNGYVPSFWSTAMRTTCGRPATHGAFLPRASIGSWLQSRNVLGRGSSRGRRPQSGRRRTFPSLVRLDTIHRWPRSAGGCRQGEPGRRSSPGSSLRLCPHLGPAS
jgi:hypothetical protein